MRVPRKLTCLLKKSGTGTWVFGRRSFAWKKWPVNLRGHITPLGGVVVPKIYLQLPRKNDAKGETIAAPHFPPTTSKLHLQGAVGVLANSPFWGECKHDHFFSDFFECWKCCLHHHFQMNGGSFQTWFYKTFFFFRPWSHFFEFRSSQMKWRLNKVESFQHDPFHELGVKG